MKLKPILHKISSREWMITGIILFAAFVLRSVHIFNVPPGVSNDEVGYFYNAYSIAKTGTDIYGRSWPLMFHIGGWPFMPVPVYILSFVYRFLEPTAFVSRLPNIMFGTLGIFVLMSIVQIVFRNTRLSLVTGAVLAVSPWHMHFSRTGYDGPIAIFFYLVGLLIGSWSVIRGRSIVWMALPWVLAIASHRASSVLAFPVLVVFTLFHWSKFSSKRRYFIEIILVTVIAIASWFLLMRANLAIGGTRSFTQEVSLFDVPVMEKEIIEEIKQSDAPLWVARIFNNKLTYTFRKIRENYLHVFSPQFLFTSGEGDGIYSIWWRGQLYIFDIPMILFGFTYLAVLSYSGAWYIALLILLAPIPAAISSGIYSMRAFLLSYLLPVLIAAGILWWSDAAHRRSRLTGRIMVLVIGLGYMAVVSSYLYQYHFRYPTYGADRWFKADKDLAAIIAVEAHRYTETIVAPAGLDVVLQYAYHNNIHPRIIQEAIAQEKKDEIRLPGGIRFVQACPYGNRPVETFLTSTMIAIVRDSCLETSKPTETIYAPKSMRIFWKIYRGDSMPSNVTAKDARVR